MAADLRSAGRFWRFLSVGALGALVDSATLAVLHETAALDPVAAAPLAKEASIAVMFLLNDRWTFAARGRSDLAGVARRFLRSNLVRAGGAAVGIAVLAALTPPPSVGVGLPALLARRGVWVYVANGLGIGTGFVFNYVFETLFTWRG